MDLKSKILVAIVAVSIITSVGYMYRKYVLLNDFQIFQTESGVPEVSLEN